MYTTVIILKLNEEAYASDSGAAYEAAEILAVQTGQYPVVYPSPFDAVGCGFGSLNSHVVSQIGRVAGNLNIDFDLTNQVEIILTLYLQSKTSESSFIQALSANLADVSSWIKNGSEVLSA